MSGKKIMASNSNTPSTLRELLQALGVLADAKSSPDARATALDKLVTYFDAQIEAEKAPPHEAASAATIAALNGRLDSLQKRISTLSMASAVANVAALQRRAAAPVDGRIEMIQRAERNTMQSFRRGRP